MSAPLLEQYRRSIKKELCYLGGEGRRGWGVNLKEIVFENKDINNDLNFTRDAPAREMST